MHFFRNLFSPLFALMIIFLGVGMLNTLVVLRLKEMQTPQYVISLISSVFFLGLTVGSFKISHLVEKIGHIRCYAVFAALIGITSLLCGMYLSPWWWVVFRFLAGIGVAGLFIVIESWILAIAGQKNRATILAVYMICLYFSISLGQYLLNIWDLSTIYPFCLACILASLSIIPISVTRSYIPVFQEEGTITLKELFIASPTSFIVTFISGILSSITNTILPLTLELANYPISSISTIMAITIIGGVCFQYPIGRLADKMDKRKMLIMLSGALIPITLLALFNLNGAYPFLFAATMFVFGGVVFALYTISISYGCDAHKEEKVVAAIGSLMLIYGIGCIMGPLFITVFLDLFDDKGFFIFSLLTNIILILFVLKRIRTKQSIPVDQQGPVRLHTPTSPVINESVEAPEIEEDLSKKINPSV